MQHWQDFLGQIGKSGQFHGLGWERDTQKIRDEKVATSDL